MNLSQRILSVDVPPVDSINARLLELERRGLDIINLGQAIPFFGPPDRAVAAVGQSLASAALHRYTSDAGMPALRAAVAARAGGAVRADDILITAGANHAFMLVCHALFEEGAAVGLLSPYFLNHSMAIKAVGARPIELIPDAAFVYDRAVLDRAVQDAALRAIVVVNPSNPTGKIFSPAELTELLDICRRHRIWLIVDEVYRAFAPAGAHTPVHTLCDPAEQTVSLWSMSKEFGMTGWRIGMLRAPPELMAQLMKAQDFSLICAPVPSQLLALHCLTDYLDHPAQFLPTLAERRHQALTTLGKSARIEIYPGEGGYFIWWRVCEETSDDASQLAARLLEEAGVCMIPGGAFGPSFSSWMRLSYGNVEESALREALLRITNFVDRASR